MNIFLSKPISILRSSFQISLLILKYNSLQCFCFARHLSDGRNDFVTCWFSRFGVSQSSMEIHIHSRLLFSFRVWKCSDCTPQLFFTAHQVYLHVSRFKYTQDWLDIGVIHFFNCKLGTMACILDQDQISLAGHRFADHPWCWKLFWTSALCAKWFLIFSTDIFKW